MTNTEIILVDGLTKEYNEKIVLNIQNLSIKKGSITGIIGPSGAGKSTFLKIINKLEPPTSGELYYFGEKTHQPNINSLEIQRKMTMVFQKPALLDLSVYDNIAFGLKARHIDKKEIKLRVESILETIGMMNLRKQNAKTLSGGEAQRISFARAMVLKPEILLLDEPTANLDPANVELLEALITKLNREEGTTILIVTHNLFQARRLTSHVVFLYQGAMIEAGEAQQVFNFPTTEKTKSFIEGKMIY